MRNSFQLLWFLVTIAVVPFGATAQNNGMVRIEGGSYLPLYGVDSAIVEVGNFFMDVYAVTNADYQKFIIQNPKWQPMNAPTIFADGSYLANWETETSFGDKLSANSPVHNVSWFAAKAYCKSKGKRLPTIDEWEYVAMADQEVPDARFKKDYNQYILGWYERPKTNTKEVGSTFKNYWGVYDLHGIIWEWTSDFNSVLLSGESRKDSEKDAKLFCGSASIDATDLMNYAAFMRYAFRGSLKANYSGNNLGFRCVKDDK